jgi:hypothetical protein
MYQADGLDRLIPLQSVPFQSVGAPCPHLAASEQSCVLAYHAEPSPHVGPTPPGSGDLIGVVHFGGLLALQWGPPNDETLSAHPLARCGLESYRSYLVERSSWLRAIVRANAVHPLHNSDHFQFLNHYVFTFHDSSFECIAKSVRAECVRGSLHQGTNSIVAVLNAAT